MKDRDKVASVLVTAFAILALFLIVNGYVGGELVSFGNYPEREATSDTFENYAVAMEYYENNQKEMVKDFDITVKGIESSDFMKNRPEEFGRQAISRYILK